MSAQKMRPYKSSQQPSQQQSARDWLEKELAKLQASIKDIQAAVVQLQQHVTGL